MRVPARAVNDGRSHTSRRGRAFVIVLAVSVGAMLNFVLRALQVTL